jgi:hypothetical protein
MSVANSWRIKTLERNLSGSVQPSLGNRGATVIRSSKGPVVPLLIGRGDSQRILNVFGKPSSSYPDVWDAIEYNGHADMWISAPSKTGVYGGVLVTKTGTKKLTSGFSSKSGLVFSALPVEESLGTGDGSTSTFTLTLTDKTYYVAQSINIKVAGTSINVSATNAATEVLTTTPNVGSGTYVRATGVLTFTFLTPPIMSAAITANYTMDRSSDAYFMLLDANPQADDMGALVTFDTSLDTFKIAAYMKDSATGNYSDLPNSPYNVSLTSGTRDATGKNIFITDIFASDDYITPVINTALALTTFVDDTSIVDFGGGSRGVATSITEFTTSWAYFQNPNKYAADIFFDCSALPGIPTIFNTLRNTYQKYSAYLLPLPQEDITAAIATKSSYSISNRGIYFYWNYGKVIDIYNDGYLYSAMMGRVAGKHADMINVYNGLAPSWIDEDGHGGQLGGGIVELVYDATETQLEAADTGQINPIIFDPQYGIMIVSDRTSLTELSDYAFIPHSRVADYIINNILTQALPYQLTKLNDITHRALVKTKAELIINPLKPAPYNLIKDSLVVCDETNNNASALARREFHLDCYVQYTLFSETIKFVFTTVGQTVTVKEVAGV